MKILFFWLKSWLAAIQALEERLNYLMNERFIESIRFDCTRYRWNVSNKRVLTNVLKILFVVEQDAQHLGMKKQKQMKSFVMQRIMPRRLLQNRGELLTRHASSINSWNHQQRKPIEHYRYTWMGMKFVQQYVHSNAMKLSVNCGESFGWISSPSSWRWQHWIWPSIFQLESKTAKTHRSQSI